MYMLPTQATAKATARHQLLCPPHHIQQQLTATLLLPVAGDSHLRLLAGASAARLRRRGLGHLAVPMGDLLPPPWGQACSGAWARASWVSCSVRQQDGR